MARDGMAGVGEMALDAATQLDRAARRAGSPLDAVHALAERLSDRSVAEDPHLFEPLLAALREGGAELATIPDFRDAIDAKVARLREAASDDADAIRACLPFCLALHGRLLDREMAAARRFG